MKTIRQVPTLLIMVFIYDSVAQFNRGEYNIKVIRAGHCLDFAHANLPSPFYGTWFRYNKTDYAFTGNWTLSAPLDEQMRIKFELQKFGDGGWKVFGVIERYDPCNAMRRILSSLWMQFVNASNLKSPETCPFPKGTITWTNFEPNMKLFQKNFVMGMFRIRYYIRRGDVLHTCAEVIFEMTQIYKY